MARPKRVPFTPQLAEHRRRLGLTQEQVAERLGITAEMVRKHERGISMPVARTRIHYCELFGASEVELGLRPRPDASTSSSAVGGGNEAQAEDVLAIMERVRRLERASIGASSLAMLDLSIDDFVNRYEREGPKTLGAPLTRQRLTIEGLIINCGHPSERRRLYSLAGRTSGLLAYMAVNRGRYPLARAYCAEAFALGEYAEDPELQAWVRGTHSFCEYYAGNYTAAVDLARDGVRYAGTGPNSFG
jgi:transcriptional regulator with XRE-family HTH domain